VCRRGGRADARLLLKSLPLNQRITYKRAVLTYKLRTSLNFNTAVSLKFSTLLQPVTSSRSLRSVDSFRLQVQHTRTEFGTRQAGLLRCGTDSLERSTKINETK